MKIHSTVTEELFLKIFKYIVLGVMALAMLGTICGLLYSGFQSLQSPKEPAPAKVAPKETINVEDFLKQLKPKAAQQQEKSEEESDKEEAQQPPAKPSKPPFEVEAAKLAGCAKESNAKSGWDPVPDALNENLRQFLETRSNFRNRGQEWVDSLVTFACAAMLHNEVIAYKKANKGVSILGPAMTFHIKSWDQIQDNIEAFNRDEERRINSERTEKMIRVGIAKEKATNALIFAGITFSIFMALALYLIIAAIESNLRNINESIQEFKTLSDHNHSSSLHSQDHT
jgi:hypothetical protein